MCFFLGKSNGRICNYRVFFEADDELISQALYPEAYGWDTSTPVDGWMLVSLVGHVGSARALLVAPEASGDPPPACTHVASRLRWPDWVARLTVAHIKVWCILLAWI